MVTNAVNEFRILLLGVKTGKLSERKIHAERKDVRFSWTRFNQNDKAWFEKLLDNEDILYNDGKSDGNGNDDENYNERSNRVEVFLEISQNSQENTLACNKLQAKVSGTVVFQWILRNF